MNRRNLAIWGALALAMAVPIFAAALSPLLAWRSPIYIAAGFAGICALALMLAQPLLAAGRLPGLALPRSRSLHRLIGTLLVVCVVLHVGGLWITSPPDVVDALLFASPTPFSHWGVIAMWALFLSAGLTLTRRRWHPKTWRLTHRSFAVVIVAGTALHALLIEGSMETITKAVLCGLVLAATLVALLGRLRQR